MRVDLGTSDENLTAAAEIPGLSHQGVHQILSDADTPRRVLSRKRLHSVAAASSVNQVSRQTEREHLRFAKNPAQRVLGI